MLRNAKELTNYSLRARDGEIGRLKDFLFDAGEWVVRYLVVDAGQWLSSRRVLIGPEALHEPEWDNRIFPADLTKDEIRNSPSVDTARPVTRELELPLRDYYGWSPYWAAGMMGAGGVERVPVPVPNESPVKIRESEPQLYSVDRVTGYRIVAADGDIGHVSDFIIEDVSWTIRYLVVDTRNWLPGRHVLIAPSWISRVDWEGAAVAVDMTQRSVKNSPPYDPARSITTDYATQLNDYYGKSADEPIGGRRR